MKRVLINDNLVVFSATGFIVKQNRKYLASENCLSVELEAIRNNQMVKEMTVREMARMGGLATKKKHPEQFSKMGIKGRRVPPKNDK